MKLVKNVISSYCELKSNLFKDLNRENYELIKNNEKLISSISEDFYNKYQLANKLLKRFSFFEFDYEDFSTVLFKLIRFFTGLSIKIMLDRTKLLVCQIYSKKERVMRYLAQAFGYEMQLKPYSAFYNLLYQKKMNKSEFDMKELINSFNTNKDQFWELDFHDPFSFTPAVPFEENKFIKFRR